MPKTLQVLIIAAALVVSFAAGVYVQHRVTNQCATAAMSYRSQLSQIVGNRVGNPAVFLDNAQDAQAAYLRCKAGGL